MSEAGDDDGLPRARPEAHGVPSARIVAFLDEAAALGIELHSLMLWRGGEVIAEGWWAPYAAHRPHMMHSATKSFLSAAVGLAVAEGYFSLQDRVTAFFPDELPPKVSDNVAAMTVEDLLTQTSGHAQGTSGSIWRSIPTSWVAEFFKIPVVHPPGAVFTYSSATSFMLSAIITKTTGQTAHDFLKPRLLAPLGIEHLSWDLGPGDINPGGNGISARTADLLKLAILHLQGGVWQGRQVLPVAWVRAATSAPRGARHGYHWWVEPDGVYHAYGVFGQFAFVFPQQNAILALTAAVPKGEAVLRALVARRFPSLFDHGPGEPAGSAEALSARLQGLTLLPPLQPQTSPMAAAINGLTFCMDANEDGVRSIRLEVSSDACIFHLRDARGSHALRVGLRDWIESDTTLSGAPLHHGYEPERLRVVAGGRWSNDHTFEMTWQFVETAFRDHAVLRFKDDTVTLDRSVNVNSAAIRRPTYRGACDRPPLTRAGQT